jgi:hypothetical protein
MANYQEQFYIKFGNNYYAGTRPILISVKTNIINEEKKKEYEKIVPKFLRDGQVNDKLHYFSHPTVKVKKTTKFFKKGSYLSTNPIWVPGMLSEQATIKQNSGHYEDYFEADINKAKKFKSKKKALDKIDQIVNNYKEIKVRPVLISTLTMKEIK